MAASRKVFYLKQVHDMLADSDNDDDVDLDLSCGSSDNSDSDDASVSSSVKLLKIHKVI